MKIHKFHKPCDIVRQKKIIEENQNFDQFLERFTKLRDRLKQDLYEDGSGELYRAKVLETKNLSKFIFDQQRASDPVFVRCVQVRWVYRKMS